MSLDANKPEDQVGVDELPLYIRETREEVNSILAGGAVAQTDLEVQAGQTSLTVGNQLSTVGLESIVVTGAGVATLATILGGTDGQIKVFIFQDANVKLVDGAKSGGAFYLNHLPALSNFEPQQDDIIALHNVGGDGASVYGYWKELYRTLSVK